MRKYTNEYANEHTHSTDMNVSLNNFIPSWKSTVLYLYKDMPYSLLWKLGPFFFQGIKMLAKRSALDQFHYDEEFVLCNKYKTRRNGQHSETVKSSNFSDITWRYQSVKLLTSESH